MVVPYAYLGFKATNKSKRKFAMYDRFFLINLTRKTLSNKNIDPWIVLMFIVYGFFVFLLASSKYCGLVCKV